MLAAADAANATVFELKARDEAFAAPAGALSTLTGIKAQLHCAPLEPLFKVR